MNKKYITYLVSLLISGQLYCSNINVINNSNSGKTFHTTCGTPPSQGYVERLFLEAKTSGQMTTCTTKNKHYIGWFNNNGQYVQKKIPGNTTSIRVGDKTWQYQTRNITKQLGRNRKI